MANGNSLVVIMYKFYFNCLDALEVLVLVSKLIFSKSFRRLLLSEVLWFDLLTGAWEPPHPRRPDWYVLLAARDKAIGIYQC